MHGQPYSSVCNSVYNLFKLCFWSVQTWVLFFTAIYHYRPGASLSPLPSRRDRKDESDVRWGSPPAERSSTLSLTERLRREFGVDASESSDEENKGEGQYDLFLLFLFSLWRRWCILVTGFSEGAVLWWILTVTLAVNTWSTEQSGPHVAEGIVKYILSNENQLLV